MSRFHPSRPFATVAVERVLPGGSVHLAIWRSSRDLIGRSRPLISGSLSRVRAPARRRGGVKIGPGPTAFTRMPSGEWSAASARVKPATAALVVSYCKLPPPATTERTEATLTMAPPLLRRISGTAALAQKT